MKLRNHSRTILFLSLANIHFLVCANSDDFHEEFMDMYGGEEFVSIATGHKQLISKAPSVASVIDAEKIREIGATDIDEVLETIPGLHVSRDYIGYNPLYVFRGIYADFNPQVLMLVNGVPITNLFHGDRNQVWGGMPTEAISRIEVIRGPGSAIYGADAFAGVINIITKDGNSLEGFDVGARIGENNSQNVHASFGKRWGGDSLGVVVEIGKTDGFDGVIEADGQTLLDSFTGTNASLAPESVNLGVERFDLRSTLIFGDVEFNVGYQGRRNGGNGAGVAQVLDPTNRFSSDRFNGDIKHLWKNATEDFSISTQLSFLDTSEEVESDLILFPSGSTGPFLDESGQPLFGIFDEGVIGNPEVFERHYRGNIIANYDGWNHHRVTVGTGYYMGDLYKTQETKNFGINPNTGDYILPGEGLIDVSDTPFIFLRENTRENAFLFAQDVIRISNDWELTAGLRYDHYSDFGDTINPRLALVWSTRQDLTTKILYGEAFRAPSFAQMGNINNPAAIGNPDLDPETMRSLELVLDYQYAYNIDVVFNAFYYQWEDIVQFVPDSVSGFRIARNSGEQDGHGIELEAHWQPSDSLTITGNYAWQDSKDKKTGNNAANAPRHQIYLRANWQMDDALSLNVQSNYVVDRPRSEGDIREEIENYILTDLTLRYSGTLDKWALSLLVKNIFDEDAQEPSPVGVPVASIPNDLPLPGRTIFGEVRYRF